MAWLMKLYLRKDSNFLRIKTNKWTLALINFACQRIACDDGACCQLRIFIILTFEEVYFAGIMSRCELANFNVTCRRNRISTNWTSNKPMVESNHQIFKTRLVESRMNFFPRWIFTSKIKNFVLNFSTYFPIIPRVI